MGRAVLVRCGGIGQLLGDGVCSCEKIYLDGDVGATEDMMAEGDDAIGILREWKLWRRIRKPIRVN